MVKARPVRQLNEKPGIVGPVFYVTASARIDSVEQLGPCFQRRAKLLALR